jgi:hypothetical protein
LEPVVSAKEFSAERLQFSCKRLHCLYATASRNVFPERLHDPFKTLGFPPRVFSSSFQIIPGVAFFIFLIHVTCSYAIRSFTRTILLVLVLQFPQLNLYTAELE